MSGVLRRCPKRIPALRHVRSSSSAAVAASPSPKIQTIPFALDGDKARSWLEWAASAKFGPGCLAVYALHRLFGWPKQSPIETVAFKAVLLPVWKVDLSAKGDGSLDGVEVDLAFQTLDATFPGFKMEPLDKLSLNAPWEAEPEDFEPETHSHQLGMDVSVVPFSLTPRRLVERARSLPVARESEQGISFDPSKFRTHMFAYYPLYVPIFLGEYEVRRDLWGEDNLETLPRATVAQIGTTSSKAFAIFAQPTVKEEKEDKQVKGKWEPSSGESIMFGFGALAKKHDEQPSKAAMEAVVPKLTELLKSSTENSVAGNGLAAWLDPMIGTRNAASSSKAPTEEGEPSATWNDRRCMPYLPNSHVNKAWIEHDTRLRAVENMLKSVEGVPDDEGVRTVVVSPKGVKVSDGKSLKEDLRGQLERAKAIVEHTKPDWLKKDEAGRLDAARRKANRGR